MVTIPFADRPLFIIRQKLQNQDFSIISSNCIGGIIYHQLGLRFLSPTINLWFKPSDFLTLLIHLRLYMQCELVEDRSANEQYPVGILRDPNSKRRSIHLYFQHYDSFKEARLKWEERKQRINYQNLIIIAVDSYEQPWSKNQLLKFDRLPYQHKIVLVGAGTSASKLNIHSAVINNCSINNHLGDWWNLMDNVRHSRNFEQWNYVDFLNKMNSK